MAYEHKFITIDGNPSKYEVDELDKMSAEGWEFVTSFPVSGHLSPSGYGNLTNGMLLYRRPTDADA